MNVVDLFLVSIYIHFDKMKERGRQIIPWFHTAFAISLFTAISGASLTKTFLGDRFNDQTISETAFLIGFCLTGGLCFFAIKYYFFDSGKNLALSEIYMNKYSSQQRTLFKTLSIAFLLLTPLLLGYVIWLKAKSLAA